MWGGLVAIFAFLAKLLDGTTLILGHIFKKKDEAQRKKDAAQSNMDKATKEDNEKDFLDARADKHGSGK